MKMTHQIQVLLATKLDACRSINEHLFVTLLRSKSSTPGQFHPINLMTKVCIHF